AVSYSTCDTAMVIPRSRSSGALSIESNARNDTFGLFFDSTLVIAAVNVVFPWSMCPIVPTFTCGLTLSNFSFAICRPPAQRAVIGPWILGFQCLAGRAPDYFFGHRSRRLFVMRKMHRKTAAALCTAANLCGIAKHFGQWNLYVYDFTCRS